MTGDATIDRLPIKIPMLDIVTVGAGGGSIAWLDPGGMLQVGPRSAGAQPGPACYGFGGTEATATDANVVRGLIRPGHFLGGQFELDVDAALAAVSRAAALVKRDAARFAEDVCTIADVTMANAVRLVSTERGYDPRGYTLVAYGGAGPLHAASVAGQLNIDRVLVPPYPGLLSAYGLLAGRFQRDFARTLVSPLDDVGYGGIAAIFDEMRDQAQEEVAGHGLDPDSCEVALALDLRYRGQGFELTLPVTAEEVAGSSASALAERFHRQHRLRYGHATPGEPVELVTYRLSMIQPIDAPATLRTPPEPEREAERAEIVVSGERATGAFHWRASLPAGFTADGPLVIEEPTATTFVPPGWRLQVDEHANLLMERTDR
jgi:N-methylhydantoinase A